MRKHLCIQTVTHACTCQQASIYRLMGGISPGEQYSQAGPRRIRRERATVWAARVCLLKEVAVLPGAGLLLRVASYLPEVQRVETLGKDVLKPECEAHCRAGLSGHKVASRWVISRWSGPRSAGSPSWEKGSSLSLLGKHYRVPPLASLPSLNSSL